MELLCERSGRNQFPLNRRCNGFVFDGLQAKGIIESSSINEEEYMSITKLDSKSLFVQAEQSGRIFRMKSGWRRMQIFAGVICCLPVITIPLGIWIIIRANKARMGLTEEGFAFTYLTTVAYRWSDIESFTLSRMSSSMFGGGLVGAAAAATVQKKTQGLKGPLQFKVKGKRSLRMIPAHTIENSMEMARQIELLSGISFLPTGLNSEAR